MPDNTASSTTAQNPQMLRQQIEGTIILLSEEIATLAERLEGSPGRLVDYYRRVAGPFRMLITLTASLQEIDQNDPPVKKAMEFLKPADPRIWNGRDENAAITRCLETMEAARDFLAYLGSKGIVTLGR